MSQEQPLVNRVAQSSLVTLKLEEYVPNTPIASFDIKDYLFKELMLKEKDFRQSMKSHDWSQYQNKVLLVHCSSKAIVPMWASMLIAAYATSYTKEVYYGTKSDYIGHKILQEIEKIDTSAYEDGLVIIKGCADHPIPPNVYLKITEKLRPVVKSLMFGEPCSTVPIYKKPRKKA